MMTDSNCWIKKNGNREMQPNSEQKQNQFSHVTQNSNLRRNVGERKRFLVSNSNRMDKEEMLRVYVVFQISYS